MTRSVPTSRVSQFLVPLPGVFLPPDVYMAGSTFIFKRLLKWHCFKAVFSNQVPIHLTHFPMYYLQSSYHCLKPSFFITVYYLTHPTTIQATGRPEALVVLLTVEHIQWTCSCCINKFPYFDSHCCHTCSKMFKGSPLFTEQSSNILTWHKDASKFY